MVKIGISRLKKCNFIINYQNLTVNGNDWKFIIYLQIAYAVYDIMRFNITKGEPKWIRYPEVALRAD